MLMKAAESRVVEKVPAGGAMWRLRSLVAMGHSNLRMARALGVHKDVVNRLVAGDVEFVSHRRFRDVRYLWGNWSGLGDSNVIIQWRVSMAGLG